MADIDKKIKHARPKLKLVSPLAAAIILGYGVTNILLGLGLLVYVNPSPQASFAVITTLTSFGFWGAVFMVLGIFKLYGYVTNDWVWMRRSLIAGVALKSVWFIALFFRWLDGGSPILLVIWFFFMYIQIVTYIHFIPSVKQRVT